MCGEGVVVVNDSEYAVKMIITITNVSVLRCTHWRGNFYSIIYLTVSSVLELVLVLKSPGSGDFRTRTETRFRMVSSRFAETRLAEIRVGV